MLEHKYHMGFYISVVKSFMYFYVYESKFTAQSHTFNFKLLQALNLSFLFFIALIFCKHVYTQLNKTVGCPETLMGCKMNGTLMSLFVILTVL